MNNYLNGALRKPGFINAWRSSLKNGGSFLSILLILAFSGCSSSSAAGGAAPVAPPPSVPLKTVYENDFLIGNIINNRYMGGDYFDLIKTHYNTVTSENDMKADNLAPRNKGDDYRWATADKQVQTMLDLGIQVHGHVLVWHQQTPIWMTTGTRAEVEANLKNHINTVLAHFKGKVMAWDVVNEAIRDSLSVPDNWKNCLRTSPWFEALGPDYIEIAFRTARAADPDITLYYNDYNMDSTGKSTAARDMIKEINDKYMAEGNTRKLIEGIGMQSHFQSNLLNLAAVRRSLERFIEIGLEISISELDIRFGGMTTGIGKDTKLLDHDARMQARQYAWLFNLYREYKEHIPRVTMWGLDDHFSWLSKGNPCLFDADLNPKKAFYAVADPSGY
jgi:endo-1,4-beta-xylanase